jgi:Xaa-Pro aminopeptidase
VSRLNNLELQPYQEVQSIAKQVLASLSGTITSSSTERSIAESAIKLLVDLGISETWYYDVPAFVLLGSRSCLSISGKDYRPANEPVGQTNLVTVDLSPCRGDIWGDCARSFVIENGQCTSDPVNLEFQEGLAAQTQLHKKMTEFMKPETKFSALFELGNQQIKDIDWENLDFLSNLGHSIETRPANRKFIDSNCHAQLDSVRFFTFEPHIRKPNGKWGFKHENIYYFNDSGKVIEL